MGQEAASVGDDGADRGGPVSEYGLIVTGTQVRAAMEATIRLWFPAYAFEIPRQQGSATGLLPFRSFNAAMDMSSRIEDQVPACVIVAPGLSAKPIKHGRVYEATWTCGVGCVVSSKDFASTLLLAEQYAATIRALVLQKHGLGGFASHIEWIGESYDEIPVEQNTPLLGTTNTFDVTVEGILDESQGPRVPPVPQDSTADWPLVEHVAVTINEET